MKRKILYVCHNHPAVAPGGAERYALELYQGMRESPEFEPLLLARTGLPHVGADYVHPGTPFRAVNGDPNQYFIQTDFADFDWLMLTARKKDLYTRFFHEFLETCQPDLVHFQHTLFVGLDAVLQTRRTLPRTPIVYTLHEYYPICHRQGQLLRTRTDTPCLEASPRRCHECFPDISPQRFFMRNRFISSHLSRVDLFLAPSRFLLDRFVEWGIPRQKIRYEEYGRLPLQPVSEQRARERRTRFGFFGQLNTFKGINVLLEAMTLLPEAQREVVAASRDMGPRERDDRSLSGPHLWVHGANLELTAPEFQGEFRRHLDAAAGNVTFAGPYEPFQLPQLMANVDWVVVPSIWWENSPLVVQEAFALGRPVICSDIGGMAEKVTHDVDGLHFRANDPASLADTIRYAASSPDVWDRLRRGISRPYGMHEHVSTLERLYEELLDQHSLL